MRKYEQTAGGLQSGLFAFTAHIVAFLQKPSDLAAIYDYVNRAYMGFGSMNITNFVGRMFLKNK